MCVHVCVCVCVRERERECLCTDTMVLFTGSLPIDFHLAEPQSKSISKPLFQVAADLQAGLPGVKHQQLTVRERAVLVKFELCGV